MIDPVDILLIEKLRECLVDLAGSGEALADRLLKHNAIGARQATARVQLLADRGEQRRWRGKVEKTGAGFTERFPQCLKCIWSGEVSRQIGEALDELLPCRITDLKTLGLEHPLPKLVMKTTTRLLLARDCDDA